ncbi:hypothetical protein PWT90_04303 [Aphanocladium album]|nr:hypothetical protein PWT90_04303 [Aphanocladium album]
MSDSGSIKNAVIQQVLEESNLANARTLIENVQTNCFEKCIFKPAGSLSKSDETCVTTCMEKYMAAWNQVNATFIARVRREQGNH